MERQEAEGWGKSVVKQLADDLRAELSGMAGLLVANLWRMKAFFEAYLRLGKTRANGARNWLGRKFSLRY